MNAETLIIGALVLPFIGAALIPVFHRQPNVREGVTLATAGLLFAVVMQILPLVMAGGSPQTGTFAVTEALHIGFRVEPLGMLFACVGSTLWIVNSIYSIGYMRGNNEPRQTSFYVCFAIAIGSVMIIAFSGNLFTLFLGYELLTVSTYPLVTHKKSEEAKRSGRLYLTLLLSTSTILLLPAIIWTSFAAGTLDFTPGGILAGKVDAASVGILLALFVFGIGKAALMPVHFWLPAAMVAPTPVSALLHAVAVVKAGVFAVLKISVYIFGIDLLSSTVQTEWLIYVAAASVLLGSLIAMTKDNLKARLAYSTVSQLAYIVLAAALATSWGVMGGGMHIIMHAFGKITLFFCAGAIYVAAHKTEISEMDGLGRVMPFTYTAFLIGALSIIGLPPFGGVWSKWYIGLGALQADQIAVVAVLMISSLLNIAYLLPIPIRGFFKTNGGDDAGQVKVKEAPTACLIAIGLTSLGCILLFFFPDPIFQLLQQIALR